MIVKEWVDGDYVLQIRFFEYFGVYCGYIALPEGHPLTKTDLRDNIVADLWVHGGISYDEMGFEEAGEHGLMEDRRVIGFDCNHMGDVNKFAYSHGEGATWKDEEYVYNELIDLLKQLKEMG